MTDADKYNFECEHIEEASQMKKQYLLTVYSKRTGGPNEISMYDLKAKRVYLKRGVYNQDGPMRLEDMYVDGMITVCARRLKITAYADSATRQLFAQNCQEVYTVVGSAASSDLGTILSAAAESGFNLKRIKTVAETISKKPAVHMELVGPSSVEAWLQVVNQSVGRNSAGAISAEAAGPASEKVFSAKGSSAKFHDCSLCIIRPHAMREGLAGPVISAILEAGLQISAMQSFSLLKNQAENFYEVYKTVIPSAHYASMLTELASGLCLVIEVHGPEDVVPRLRELCGPFDVEIAKHLRPNTIRACLGRDNVHNVVHCTDLPEDGVLECQYFFSILQTAG
eukprot:CAMPEP_0115067302 /NCGR_PEP_ID=MMETSP0227-20121206/11312_1 /TAXON_ID=89957 /ORGANISM="Polarella glacialis, Strain CCMP 1383" /LENGTH=339 /DNA_ID=CAMNT_0002453349 /DNA_START=68 /DNA_END=1087 /DNA_ORIENTATION=+